jgi:hypothetical protein
MNLFTSRIFVACAAATVTAIAVGGVAWAVQSPVDAGHVVHACYDPTNGNMHLNVTGACPTTGQKTPITWNAQGQPGPAGPKGLGAAAVLFASNVNVTSAHKTVGGYQYFESCSVSGTANGRQVTTEFSVVGKPGVNYSVAGPVLTSSDDAPGFTNIENRAPGSGTNSFSANSGGVQHYVRIYLDLTVSGADGSVQQFKVRVTADGRNLAALPAGEQHCMVEGTILPT